MKAREKLTEILFISICFGLYACTSIKPYFATDTKYKNFKKSNENIKVSYNLPSIQATGKSIQSQTKGGVIISVEVVPFEVKRMLKQTPPEVTYKDPNKADCDNFETSFTPYYEVKANTPNGDFDNVMFKIRIKNNEQVPLRLSEIGVAIQADGTQFSFPSGYLDEWNKGMIMTGYEKEYYIRGPQLAGLSSSQIFYIFLNGVPTSFDNAGNVTKKNNFEWYFECKSEIIVKNEEKTYSYESKPIQIDICNKCNGEGSYNKEVCPYCKGTGKFFYDGKYNPCNCHNGYIRNYCDVCNRTGKIARPLSTIAPIDYREDWKGWNVKVTTNPENAKVSIVANKVGKYTNAGLSNLTVTPWIAHTWDNYSKNEYFPIIVECQNMKVKVLPFDKDGKEISNIVVDFTGETPIVTKGKLSE